MRALAVLAVLGRHMLEPPKSLGWAREPLLVWKRCGWAGVDLFFVLSGFLVSGLLFAEYRQHGSLRPVRFLIRRGFKIYPAFYVLILLTVVWRLAAGELAWKSVLVEVFYVQNYFFWDALWTHTWTLAVEEHFYLCLAAALPLMARRGGDDPFARWMPAVGLTILAIQGWRTVQLSVQPHYDVYYDSHHRFDALLMGLMLSWMWRYRSDLVDRWVRPHAWRWLGLGAALWVPVLVGKDVLWSESTGGIGTFLLDLGCASGLAGLLCVPAPTALDRLRPVWTALARMGFFSYSIYLWHIPVRDAVRWVQPTVEGPEWYLREGTYMALSILVGILAARLIELPVLKVRERWYPSRSRGSLTEQPTHRG